MGRPWLRGRSADDESARRRDGLGPLRRLPGAQRAATPARSTRCSTADGRVRSAYRALHDAIAPTAATDLAVRSEALDRAYLDQGITFSLSGEERPFPLDIVPRVISAAEWSKLQRGIVQRVGRWRRSSPTSTATPQIVRDGVLPRRLITSCAHFHRAAAGPEPAERGAHPRRGHRRRPRRGGHLPGAGGQPPQPVRGVLRHGEPPDDGPGVPRPVHPAAGARGRRLLGAPPAGPARGAPRRTWPTRRSWCSPPASTTPRTSSTPCWPGRWASSWSRAATCSAATTSSTCAPPAVSSGST